MVRREHFESIRSQHSPIETASNVRACGHELVSRRAPKQDASEPNRCTSQIDLSWRHERGAMQPTGQQAHRSDEDGKNRFSRHQRQTAIGRPAKQSKT